MNVKYFVLALVALAAAACQKDPSPSDPAPTADFAFARSSATATEVTVATYDNVYLVDQSTRAVSYRYTLGNDSVRTTAAPRFSYAKPGLYTVTLTVRGAGGQTATASKRVRVLERVAKQVVIQNLNDEVNSPQHNLVNGTYWAVVRLGENRTAYPQPANGNPSFEAPILYQSPKVTLTQAMLPYAFTLPTPLVLNFPALRANLAQQPEQLRLRGRGLRLRGIRAGRERHGLPAHLVVPAFLPVAIRRHHRDGHRFPAKHPTGRLRRHLPPRRLRISAAARPSGFPTTFYML